MRYKITIPGASGKFNANSKKEAIDKALAVHKLLLDKMIASGDIYRVPDICSEWTRRDAIRELGDEVPIKPSRKLGRRSR